MRKNVDDCDLGHEMKKMKENDDCAELDVMK